MSSNPNPLAGLNPTADSYLNPSDGKTSIARDFMAESIIAGEVSSLYARAALASAEGSNDERANLMAQAHERLAALLAAATEWQEVPADLRNATDVGRRTAHEAGRAGLDALLERDAKKRGE